MPLNWHEFDSSSRHRRREKSYLWGKQWSKWVVWEIDEIKYLFLWMGCQWTILKERNWHQAESNPHPINHDVVELIIVPTSRIPLKYNLFPIICDGLFFGQNTSNRFSRKKIFGSSCSTVVERTPSKRELAGSITARCCLFSLSILSNVSFNRSLE